jgi:hypothetical protein
MRKELEQIKTIEDYLENRLSAEEKARFEDQLANDPQLKEAVQLQQQVMQGVQRAALKQQVQQAGQQFMRWRNFTRWGLGGLSVVIIGAIALYVTIGSGKQTTGYEGTQLPAFNEAGEQLWADADKHIPAQVFTIQAGKDTVIETKKGIVLAVPANGFLDEDNKPFTGSMSLVVKEALDAATVMQAGFSTMSGDQLLETGGMFYIDARQGDKQLKINPAAGIHAEVPTDTIRPGMQLYSGKRLPDGRIDWINPVSLEKDLVAVDILSLDFYPPMYLKSLQAWGYNSSDKGFTDSLYYSLSPYFGKRSDAVRAHEGDSIIWPKFDEVYIPFSYAVSPSTIQAIWSNEFQNTLLATREFEERMCWIHASQDNDVLELYINNLDRNLWEIDSMAALLISFDYVKEKFVAFAARKDGKVKKGVTSLQSLRDYYQVRSKAYRAAAIKTNDSYWAKQKELDSSAERKREQYNDKAVKRQADNFQQEFQLNLKEAYRQLGYDTSKSFQPPPPEVYQVQVTNTGWNNIDREVLEATANRTTLDVTDPATGKRAVIQYQPVSFEVEQPQQYERLYVYLLPDKLSSFMRVDSSIDGKYAENLNELIQYNAVVIGYKGEQAFYYTQAGVKPGEYKNIRLEVISNDQLNSRLNGMGKLTQAADLQKDQDYLRFEHIDQKRIDKNLESKELIWKLIYLINGWPWRPAEEK